MPYVNKKRPYKKEYKQQRERGEHKNRMERQRARRKLDKTKPDRNNNGSFKDGIINNPKLMYPGLSIHNLNGSEWYNGDKGQDYTDLSSDSVYNSDVLNGTGYNRVSVRNGNLFNPSEPNGSNFELTQWVKDHIKFVTFSGGNTNIPQNTTGPEGAEWSYEDGFTGGGQEGSPQVSGYGMDEGGFS